MDERELENLVRVPMSDEDKSRAIIQIKNLIEAEQNGPISIDELADKIGVPVAEVIRLIRISNNPPS